MDKMRILFPNPLLSARGERPGIAHAEHCRELVRQGHDVTVITSAPNHPKGEMYPGYCNRLFQPEMVDGLRVVRFGHLVDLDPMAYPNPTTRLCDRQLRAPNCGALPGLGQNFGHPEAGPSK